MAFVLAMMLIPGSGALALQHAARPLQRPAVEVPSLRGAAAAGTATHTSPPSFPASGSGATQALLRAMDGELGGSLGASQAACGSLARSGPLDSVLPPGTSLGVIRSRDAVHEREA